MKVTNKIVGIATAAALAAAPGVALAQGSPHGNNGKSQSAPGQVKKTQGGTSTPGTSASPSAKAKAYGRYCQGESKRHVAGQSGTPFSKCVNDMAQLANNAKTNPHRACANESRKHVAGSKGTPYSQCVVAAAKLRGHHTSTSSTGSTGSTGSGS